MASLRPVALVVFAIFAFEPAVGITQKAQTGKFLMNNAVAKKPVQRIEDLARWANFDCQDKSAMLQAYANPTVLEVGSFNGSEIPKFAGHVKHMWSFEPNPEQIPKMKNYIKNAKMSNYAEAFNMAVSNETGHLKFFRDGNNSMQNTLNDPPPWVSKKEFEEKAIKVEVTTLDNAWMNLLGKSHITMLKLDTQGHEPFILKGATKLLAEDPPDIVHTEFAPKLYKAGGCSGTEMLHVLYDAGYKCFDCQVYGPPALDAASRDIDHYEQAFGEFMFKGADHGQWTDLVCLQ